MVLEAAQYVPLERLELPEHHDALHRAVEAAVWRSFAVLQSILRSVEQAVVLVGIATLLVLAHWALPLFVLVGTAPSLWVQLHRGRQTYGLYRRQTAEQRRVDYLLDLLTQREAAKEIRLYGLGGLLSERWHALADALRRQRFRLLLRQQFMLGSARILSIAGISAGAIFLLWLVTQGTIAVAAFFMLVQASMQFRAQTQALLRTVSQVHEELLYLSDLRSFTQYTPAPAAAAPRRPPAVGDSGITFDAVSFAYPGGPDVLRDISLHIATLLTLVSLVAALAVSHWALTPIVFLGTVPGCPLPPS